MQAVDGKARAADIIEDTLGIRIENNQQAALDTAPS
jgi:hypothetical protein